jgi:vacuolar protein sorting-associated protein VTA1
MLRCYNVSDTKYRQTAITFEAAATFFQLINIWGTPDAETEQKIKFSKWNAARILRAIKDGKDPNESNPKQEEEQEIDNNDPELQAIMGGGQPQPASVEDAPDEDRGGYLDPSAASGSHYSPAPVSAPTSPPQASAAAPEQVSPIAPPDQVTTDGYFPSAADDDPPLELPSAPGMAPTDSPNIGGPSAPTVHPSLGPQGSPTMPPSGPFSPPVFPSTPQNFYQQSAPTPPVVPHSQQSPYPSTPHQPPAPPSATNSYYQQPPHNTSQRNVPTFLPPPQPQSAPPPQQSFSGGPPTNAVYNADDKAIVTAQKHAKWAISALNFDDVPTAVRELKAALAVLGGS